MALFRVYTSDNSFTKLNIPSTETSSLKEFQVALTFGRDYNGKDSTNGKFIPYWDTTTVTPQVIADFKENHANTTKVLITIGNQNSQFPFKINEDNVPAWVSTATESLTHLIKAYNLDGIDINYESIEVSNSAIFVHCIGELIKALKDKKLITEASISPNRATSDEFYKPLYLEYADYIDTVAYQCSADEVIEIPSQYEAKKVLLGYSGVPEDWAVVSPPVFFVAFFLLLNWEAITGASIKVTNSSISYFPPKWIIDIIYFFSNPGPFRLR